MQLFFLQDFFLGLLSSSLNFFVASNSGIHWPFPLSLSHTRIVQFPDLLRGGKGSELGRHTHNSTWLLADRKLLMSDSASVIDSRRAEDGQVSGGGGGTDEAKGTNGGGTQRPSSSEQEVSSIANGDFRNNPIAGINSRPAPQALRQVEHGSNIRTETWSDLSNLMCTM